MIPDEFLPLIYEISSISKLFWREFAIAFELSELFERGNKLPRFATFSAEVFHRLYYEPEPQTFELLPPESQWAQKLHTQFSEIIEFDNLVLQCEGNQLAAGIATQKFCQEILDKLPQPRYELQDPQPLRELVKTLKNNPQSLEEILNQETKMSHFIQEVGSCVEEFIQQLQQVGKKAVQDALEYGESLDESQVRFCLREAASQTQEKLEEVSQWLEMVGISWGREEAIQQPVSPTEKMQLLQTIGASKKLQAIATIAGRLKSIAERKRRTQSDDAFGQLTTVEPGNNLARLLPSELQKLSEPALFPLFAKGFYEHSLLQYKIVGKEKKSKGPMVVCLDASRSMKGLPDTWAKAVTAVLGQIAYKDNRHFRVIHFHTKIGRIDDFPPKHHNYRSLLESMLSFSSGGGTNWEIALTEAMKCIENDSNLNKADIVMITDGECDVDQEFLDQLNRQKKQRELNILSILIGNYSERTLRKFSDRIWIIRQLNTEAALTIEELFLI